MQPNEPTDREGREPAEAAPPAHEAPAFTRDAPLTTRGTVPSPVDPAPPEHVSGSGIDDELPGADGTLPPASEADAIGYDDPSVSPVEALRAADASDDRTGQE